MSVLVARLQSVRDYPLGGSVEEKAGMVDLLRAEAGAALFEAALMIEAAARSAGFPEEIVRDMLGEARAVLAHGGCPDFLADRFAATDAPDSFVARLATPRPAGCPAGTWSFAQAADRHEAALRISMISDTLGALLARKRLGRARALTGVLPGLAAQCRAMPDGLATLPAGTSRLSPAA